METLINNFTSLPTLSFFAIWSVLFSLLFFSIIVGFDMDLGIDVDVEPSSSILPSFMIARGITKIPLTLSFFIVFSVGLTISYCLQWVVIPEMGLGLFQGELNFLEKVLGIALFLPIFIVSLYVSSPILNFLGKHIKNPEKDKPLNLIGMECIITTGSVSDTFGEAKVIDGNKEYIIHVVSKDSLVRDNRAVIVERQENGDYLIKRIH